MEADERQRVPFQKIFYTCSLSDVVTSSIAKLQSAGTYFSSWNRFKELFLVPSVKSKVQMSSGYQSGTARNGGVSVIRVWPKSADEKKKLQKHSDLTATSLGQPPKNAGARQFKSDQQEDDPLTTSPAKEVEQYLMDHVYFAQSQEPRDPRPPSVKYRVGQVVHHRQDQYVGVIIGWDAVGKVRSSGQCPRGQWGWGGGALHLSRSTSISHFFCVRRIRKAASCASFSLCIE